MKLLVLTEDFYPSISGGAHAKWRFCQLAAGRGHEVVVYTPRTGDTPKRERVDGVEIRRPLKTKPDTIPPQATAAFPFRLIYGALLCLYLTFRAGQIGFDAVYTGSNTLHWVGTFLSWWREVPGVSFVGYTPSMDPDGASRLKRLLEGLTFRFALNSTTFCRTPAIRDKIRAVSDGEVEIIYGIVNAEKIRAAFEENRKDPVRSSLASDDETLFVFVGRLSEVKNVPEAVAAVGALPDSYRLAIVGDGPQRATVEEAIGELALGDRVELVGERPHEDTLAIVAAADGLLLPSRVEAFPTVVFEGLTLGCEVFATPVGILPEIDHERLHLQPSDEFAERIAKTEFLKPDDLDERTLEEYSLERYTDAVFAAIETDGGNL